jgi:two-component system response regulator AtoC
MNLDVPAEAAGVSPSVSNPDMASPVRVLVVSESEQPHLFLRHALTRAGWMVVCRFSAGEAASLLEKEEFALVVCDAELPDDGWKSLLARCQSLPCPARLIVFCRYCEVALWADVLSLGAYDLLMYPFDTQEVLRISALAWQGWAREAGYTWRERLPSRESAPRKATAAAAAD